MSVQLRPFTIWNVFLVDQGLELDLDCQESMYCSVLDCFTGGSICASPFVSFVECFKGSLSLCMLGMNDGFELLHLPSHSHQTILSTFWWRNRVSSQGPLLVDFRAKRTLDVIQLQLIGSLSHYYRFFCP